MSKYVRHPLLPKANLITIRRSILHKCWFRTSRHANAREFFIFKVLWFTVRRPWLKGPAKQLYPELFNKPEGRDASK